MAARGQIAFGPFRLDERNECLWQGSQAISLRPKAYALLRLLVAHAGELVTKQQVLDAVWPGTFVTDAVLKDSIRQLRKALNDDAESPAYIETAHRRGYRFIGKIAESVSPTNAAETQTAHIISEFPSDEPAPLPLTSCKVLGREAELAKMQCWWDRALRGERQVVFITGEPGIGKTTLAQAVLEKIGGLERICIARGQCLEHYGAGEPFLPVLEGFSRLIRQRSSVTELLRRHAPTWLAQMPGVISASEQELLQQRVLVVTRERMLREMAEAVEALTAATPLIIVLEDLHWSDYSTLDLISYVARRRDPARLMVIGTYRPVEVILGDHPLKGVKRELQAHQLCHELPLEYLTEEAIAQYLTLRFPHHRFPKRLVRLIHRRTEGNPLFMVNVAEYLADEKLVIEQDGEWQLRSSLDELELGVPENIRQLIERQIERLGPEERKVLEGASVVGMECSTAAIAAGLGEDPVRVEERCEELVRRHQFLLPARIVQLPDGMITPRYRFAHVLYLEVPYRLIPALRCSRIHARIAQAGEAIYGDHVDEIAAELAMHFEDAGDLPRAVKYLLMAAETASRRSAHQEAQTLARRGLELCHALPASSECADQQLRLYIIYGVSLTATKGFAAPEVEQVYQKARELCWQHGASPQLFKSLWLLGVYYYFRAELRSAREIADQLLELGLGLRDEALTAEAHRALGVTLVDQGSLKSGLQHLEQVPAHSKTVPLYSDPSFTGQDPEVVSQCFAARALWALGYPDQAWERMQSALSRAHHLEHPESRVVAAHFAARLHQLRGDVAASQEQAERVIALAEDQGLELWLMLGTMDRAWAEAEQGQLETGIQQMREDLSAYAATGARLWRAHFLVLLAAMLGKAGQMEEGLTAIADALVLVTDTGDHYPTAEVYRVKGELLMMQAVGIERWRSNTAEPFRKTREVSSSADEAKRCFVEALRVARQQEARSWELRAATSLTRLYRMQARREESRRVLSEIYAWFTEGHETADLKTARTLLDLISHPHESCKPPN
jgi:DNA-binding winged helix-turn-helix (wHTH) protein/predicted ATPase